LQHEEEIFAYPSLLHFQRHSIQHPRKTGLLNRIGFLRSNENLPLNSSLG
jgi:hypothetical protein